MNNRYQVYDLKSDIIYEVPANTDQRIPIEPMIQEGNWKVTNKTSFVLAEEESILHDLSCIKVTEKIISGTPFGNLESTSTSYYVDLDDLLEKGMKKQVYSFLGVRDMSHKPYLFKMKIVNSYEDHHDIFILDSQIKFEEVDSAFLTHILTMPIRD